MYRITKPCRVRPKIALSKHKSAVPQRARSRRQFAELMRQTVEEIQRQGITTIRAMRDELNRRQVQTYRSTAQGWHIRTVHALMKRIAENQSFVKQAQA